MFWLERPSRSWRPGRSQCLSEGDLEIRIHHRGVEEVRALLGRVLRRIQRLFVVGLDAHEQVEVVFHQAVRERVGDGLDVPGILIREVAIIFRFEEKILPVDAPVVDVVVMAGFERREVLHGACVRC